MSAGSGDENRECPLCLELLEMDDLNFFPCTCGYQICRFCWHRIRTNENGLCPACRKQYSEDPANFKPLTAEELQKIKNEKRQKDLQRKQKISENRKHLANVRVVQKNLVFVVGLPTRLADAEELKKMSYFGRFGKIMKVICNQSTSYAGTQGPSASAYVTYQRSEDALRAIQSVNNSKVDGRTLKASLGTTKYCSNFLKKLQCPKQDCMYLHELGDEAASFTKEDMQAGKHQEYERKLYDQMVANSSQNRKETANHDKGKSFLRGGGSQRKKRRKQPSPTEQVDVSFFQKERWPSPPKRDDIRSSNNSNNSSQSPQNNSSPELEPSCSDKSHDTGSSLEQFPSKDLSPPNIPESTEEFRQTSIQPQPPQQQPQQIQPKTVLPNHCISSSSFFQTIDSLDSKEVSQKSPPGLFTDLPQNTSSHLYKNPGFHSTMVNGLSHTTQQQLKNLVTSQEWTDQRSREFLKLKMSDMMMNGTSVNHDDVNCSNSLFISNRMVPLNRLPGVHSGVESVNHLYNGVNTCRNLKNSYPPSDNSSFGSQDDDLGFDPWHESSKGLADLMVKEADEKAKAYGLLLSRNAGHLNRRMPIESSLNPCVDTPHFLTRQTAPPPGFSLNNYGANTIPRTSFGDAFPSKMLPVMSSYNQSSSAHLSTQQYPQQIMHPQSGSLLNNVLHSAEAGMRPQSREWQENLANIHQRNLDSNFGSLSQRIPAHTARINSMWNTTNNTPSDMSWLQQDQSLNHGYNTENRNVSPQMERMFQQLKLSDQVKFQNHLKFNSFSSFRGGSS